MTFTKTNSTKGFQGHHVNVTVDTFRFSDGKEVKREIVRMGDVVAVVAFTEEGFYLVSQPREATDGYMLEIVAGGVDDRDDSPFDAAKRELSEELGFGANKWEDGGSFFSSPGILDEKIHLWFASDLYPDDSGVQDESERIDPVFVKWQDMDTKLSEIQDGKSLIGLLKLKASRG